VRRGASDIFDEWLVVRAQAGEDDAMQPRVCYRCAVARHRRSISRAGGNPVSHDSISRGLWVPACAGKTAWCCTAELDAVRGLQPQCDDSAWRGGRYNVSNHADDGCYFGTLKVR